PVETFSKGMRQKLAIARALVHDPAVLFLDEPTANLDPEAAKIVRDTILELRHEKRTIVLNTHNLGEAQRVCDRVGILRTRLLLVGSVRDLQARLPARRTVVRLERVTPELLTAVRERLGSRPMEVAGDELRIEAIDPDRENPEIAEAVLAAGGRIRSISHAEPSLEEVYLRLINEGAAT
ncbi:MAG TPA: ABC transporter ATP-binding protein, partial [Thermoplasmata archaeon]|nr:ABC transporter ATP-binding protein [Thermoplasmata archaeon]